MISDQNCYMISDRILTQFEPDNILVLNLLLPSPTMNHLPGAVLRLGRGLHHRFLVDLSGGTICRAPQEGWLHPDIPIKLI